MRERELVRGESRRRCGRERQEERNAHASKAHPKTGSLVEFSAKKGRGVFRKQYLVLDVKRERERERAACMLAICSAVSGVAASGHRWRRQRRGDVVMCAQSFLDRITRDKSAIIIIQLAHSTSLANAGLNLFLLHQQHLITTLILFDHQLSPLHYHSISTIIIILVIFLCSSFSL